MIIAFGSCSLSFEGFCWFFRFQSKIEIDQTIKKLLTWRVQVVKFIKEEKDDIYQTIKSKANTELQEG